MNIYRKGVKFEREIVNIAREQGKIAFRSAGSHSSIDVCVIDTILKKIELIQCKTGKTALKIAEKIKDLKNHTGYYLVEFSIRTKP